MACVSGEKHTTKQRTTKHCYNIGMRLMKSSVYRLPFALSVVFASMLSGVAYAEDDDDIMGDMSLQDLFAIDTDIASNTSRPVIEQPSIISVVTREQIQNSPVLVI